MLAILLKTLPFFAVIGLGYAAGRTRFFSQEATAYLTRFVFYFALSAMLFGFSANLDVAAILSWPFVFAYLLATSTVWLVVAGVALARRTSAEEAVFEAHTGVIGNVGFLGIPMLALLLGPQAVGPVLLVLAVDLIVFSSILTMIITGLRAGRVSAQTFGILATGLAKNPMIVSVVLGIAWGATGLALPTPANEFLTLLGAAATPCALFAIGASLAGRSAERIEVAAWLSLAKLVLHPAAVAGACWLLGVTGYPAGVMIAAAALPVAGNVFILAQHYGVAPQRVSTAILLSTAASVLTVTAVIALLSQGGYI
ncbi:AEC family transporter [Rhodobacter calidifons]|uniref:AEC family transporter n=1 Tax=Rhodobacter calidifons TaxID=2715277 RepID=A0ABX0G646_9RHOB|nr:AEC family transporter [Rhodobacter calidifons]NHB76348.1 AEC family transporter [Rhodobacter calidifons]